MKRLALIFMSLLFISLSASCKANDAADIPSDADATGRITAVLSGAGSDDVITDIPSDIEIAYISADKVFFEDLKQVEDNATIIVEADVRKNLGQKVSTHYDEGLKKELPDAGYTKWEIEVTKVYKGDLKAEDKLVLLQNYYVWTYSDGKEQFVTLTDLKPAEKDRKYLLFLKYDDRNEGYWPVGDYEGMFAVPTDEMKKMAKDMTLEQSDFDVYNYEQLNYLIPIYNEVVPKYFD